MNIKTKKIVAREFLVFLACLAIAIVTFLIIYPYNNFKQKQIDNLTKDISSKIIISDSLSKAYRLKYEKQLWFTDRYMSKLGFPKGYSNEKIWNGLYRIAKTDSVKYKWENKWDKDLIAFNKELGFETPQSFQDFILTNIVYKNEIEKNQEAIKINAEADVIRNKIIEIRKKIVPIQNQFKTACIAFIIAVIILFVFRYMFYGTKWSIKTLRS